MNLIHKEFLIALANGEEVEVKFGGVWRNIGDSASIGIFKDSDCQFRIKPKTVTLSMEIPMPFVPKVGEYYWFLELTASTAATSFKNAGAPVDKRLIARGVYRTKKEVEQALASHEAAIAKLLECAK